MKRFAALSLMALTGGCMAEAPPAQVSAETRSELMAAIEGRAMGEPQFCVRSQDLLGNRSAGEGALIFNTRSRNLIYVNRPPGGCPELRPGLALKTRTPSTSLCAGDIVEVFDPVTGFTRGGCGLGEFTPYRRMR